MFQGKPNQLELCYHFDTLYAACSLESGKRYVVKETMFLFNPLIKFPVPLPFFPYQQDGLKALYLQLHVLFYSSYNTLISNLTLVIVSALVGVFQYE